MKLDWNPTIAREGCPTKSIHKEEEEEMRTHLEEEESPGKK